MDDNSGHKNAKGTKKCVTKRKFMFKNYKDCLFTSKIILKLQQRFRSDYHNVYTEQINKIPLSSNDDKRLQTFDKITTYPYGANEFKVCKSMYKWSILMIIQMNTKQHNLKWPCIPNHPYRLLITESSGSGKTYY